VNADPRSRRIAVVADSLLDALLPRLHDDGFGTIQLPPADLEPEVNDYEVVLADDGSNEEELREALARLGVGPLPQYAIQPPSTSRLTPEP
jgi:hypothetical protein